MGMSKEIPYFLTVDDPQSPSGERLVLRQTSLVEGSLNLGADIADRTIEVFGTEPLDLIGISFTGAFVANLGNLMRLDKGVESNFLLCHPKADAFFGWRRGLELPPTGARPVLFDNSLRSGKTLRRIMKSLDRSNIQPTHFLKLIDYEDEREVWAHKLIGGLDMTCLSVYKRSEITHAPRVYRGKIEAL